MPMDRHMRAVRRPPTSVAVKGSGEAVQLEAALVPLSVVNEPQEETSQASEGTETPDPKAEREGVVPDPGVDFSLAASLIE